MTRSKQTARKQKNANKNKELLAEETAGKTTEEDSAQPPNEGKTTEHEQPTQSIDEKKGKGNERRRRRKCKNKTGEVEPPAEKKRIRLGKQAELEKEAALSRYTQLPSESTQTILVQVKKFLQTRITDKWLLLEKEKLEKKHPEHSEDSIASLLLTSLGNDERFKGNQSIAKKELFAKLGDPMLIKSTRVSSYISIGIQNINTYIERGGSISCILCGGANLRESVICRDSVKDVPIFVVPALTYVLMDFTELKEEKYCDSIAFKKVKDSPFNDLVELIAESVPNEISPSVSVNTADGLTQIPWKESINRYDIVTVKSAHSNNDESIVVRKHLPDSSAELKSDLPDSSAELKLNFTEGLPQMSVQDQQIILAKIEAAFEYTFPRLLITGKRNQLKHATPRLDADEIERILYVETLCTELCAGLDVIDILSSPFTKSKNSYVITANIGQMLHQHVKKGGSFHFILYCNSATNYVNKTPYFQSFAENIPLLVIEGLSSIFYRYYTSNLNSAMLAFKKAEDNPLEELIKFVEGKIPEQVSVAKPVAE